MITRDKILAILATAIPGMMLAGLLLAEPIAARRPRVLVTPPVAEAKQPTPAYVVRFSPHGGCQQEIVSRITAATQSIYVRAYGFTSQPIGNALCEAAKRGVKVKIICDRSERGGKHSQSDECRAAGCEVLFDDKHPIAHSKVMVFDERWCVLGSYNFTNQAELNAETMLVINLPPLAKELIADFDKHHEHSEK